ncbi:GTP diphosphokinase [Neptunomonas phycophila]|jgi:GTP pyrophosphokinase|uniref:GTP pyrophosphokinase n=1 Tax=Neptunomonas phycophila TaxID=1572645 RepID=A0AAW7XIJ6_9GAMM|nr:GTP diphosphokinase [Neptunomonas phycophila]MBT3147105.1 GTP diphosphokinase [Neptunomonas phycophila]MDO6452904.1 GTP diphosphokinase [Neptunomonas phycophila]MDO6467450.1 GTP diphosphokinase [Neptunomonas phycophila]MDO6783445.1 GTP diphosphokinase [Neptunomonas phycophila]MDP2521464.1 GTP diphosphokinase [Neptunomonas phycophila]
MVKVREDHPIQEDGSVDLDLWIDRLSELVKIDDRPQVRKACEIAKQVYDLSIQEEDDWSGSGVGSFVTGLEMAQILAELQQDQESIVAAILYRSVREDKLKLDTVINQFGPVIGQLIMGVIQMAAIGSRANPRTEQEVLGTGARQLETVRKMLVAMIDDVRVALIKIAERTCAIRGVKNASRRKRYLVAREVFDIYAPLAHRLGIGHIKWELEDLSFRYLKPTDYKSIAKLLDEKRLDRQEFIESVVSTLKTELTAQNIDADVEGRAKHIYSIWRKMQRKNIDFNQVYDVRAVRILVPEIRDCYTALGIIHGLWRNIPHEFDDYIASPKPNGYRSLHTAVFGPEGKVLEVQVRTFDMHEEAELGVCAHHLYKGTDTNSRSDAYEDKIAWLRQVLEWHEDLGESAAIGDMLRGDVVQDRLYVFTPDGHVIDMPLGSTAVDFAYRVHTEIGHRCRGAKVNGRIIPLNKPLKTGDQVEILTSKEEHPRRDWLNANLGYVTTSRGRAKVAHWFKMQDRDKNVEAGRQMTEREFKRLAIDMSELDFKKLAHEVNYSSADDVFAALGAGDIRLSQILNAAQRQVDAPAKTDEQLDLALPVSAERGQAVGDKGIRILGVGNLLTTIASCCKPVPGDPIVGFITQGRGVSIHREDCSNLLSLKEHEAERIVTVDWGEEGETTYPVDLYIEAYDRSGLLRDVMMVMAHENLNVLAANTLTDKTSNIARLSMTLEISRLELLGKIMDKINQVPNVIDVHRQRSGFR